MKGIKQFIVLLLLVVYIWIYSTYFEEILRLTADWKMFSDHEMGDIIFIFAFSMMWTGALLWVVIAVMIGILNLIAKVYEKQMGN